MRVGIIGAMDLEVDKLKEILTDRKVVRKSFVDFWCGKIANAEVVVAVAGIGKVNAAICAEAMILTFNPDVLLNIGVAGGIKKGLHMGDVTIATGCVEHDMDITPLGDKPGYIHGIDVVQMPCTDWVVKTLCNAVDDLGMKCSCGMIASGDQFIADPEKKKWILNTFDAIAAEMEGASIGHVCYQNGLDYGVIRTLSDSADEEANVSYEEFKYTAADISVNIVVKFLELVK